MVQKHLAKLLGALVVAIAVVAVAAPVASAVKPKPPYEQFAGCPNEAKVSSCIHSTVTGGHFQMGNKDVPITNPMVLTGGVGPFTGPVFFNSEGGLSKAKQKVPGGIIGLTGLTWLFEFFGSEALTLYATTELAGTPILEGLEALRLPIKVHLEHSVLGNNCYVGSTTTPISLRVITGTTAPPAPNKPITGKEPTLTFDFATEILHADKGVFVDNSFAAPGASGCVLTLFGFIPISINGLVNAQSGLPAAAGTNETIQNIDAELVERELVYP